MVETKPDPQPSKMCSDGRRALLALAASFIVPVLGRVVVEAVDPASGSTRALNVVLILIGWNTFVVVYVILTAHTFARIDTTEFTRRMAARDSMQSKFWNRLTPWGDGPTYAVESAVVAFVVVLVLPRIQGIKIDDLLLIPLSLSILLSCWALSVVSYALQYAKVDLQDSGFDFPGTRTHAWGDYLYFSLAVATTFGATDINITTPRMRRVVNFHTVLTFIYNSVIVATLASLLLS
jgi:uncharacterized membrane protein